ncbi:aminotransferase class V-fold PLP-dependent enzyme, partial [Candidatus Bathyarchaeota archaeon]|nr:aminotransferase class V-fold PLP-dependent enzyme [Candidatus Bathyarchaeota archaeon]
MNKSFDEVFPLAEKWIYLDNAAQGAPPRSTLRIMEEYVKDRCSWLSGEEDWSDYMGKWSSKVENSKNLFAKIIGAKDDEIAFIPNTTTGINTVFSMLPIKPGQSIVITSISYPMGAAVSLKQIERGAEVKFLKSKKGEIPIEEFEKNIDDKTSAVLVDQAGWHNGYLHDLEAISNLAHEHGAYLIVDGVQSAGAYPHDVHRDGVDFLAVSTYKWLLGGPYSQSVGYLYIDQELVDKFQPAYIGNQTIVDEQLQANIYDKFDL